MGNMKLTPLSEVVDRVWGKTGTPERDEMEARLKEELQASHLGEAIREERLKQNLTQEERNRKSPGWKRGTASPSPH